MIEYSSHKIMVWDFDVATPFNAQMQNCLRNHMVTQF